MSKKKSAVTDDQRQRVRRLPERRQQIFWNIYGNPDTIDRWGSIENLLSVMERYGSGSIPEEESN
jgi:hypothetical protein